MVTLLFFDCEFTDLSGSASLVSAGFITQSGEQFYAELSDYEEDSCNDFVKTTVLPLLSLPPISTADFAFLADRLARQLGRRFSVHRRFRLGSEDPEQDLSLGRQSHPEDLAISRKTPDNFTNGIQRSIFNDEMAAFFLRHPDQKQHTMPDGRSCDP